MRTSQYSSALGCRVLALEYFASPMFPKHRGHNAIDFDNVAIQILLPPRKGCEMDLDIAKCGEG
jgi:hypothetical protein